MADELRIADLIVKQLHQNMSAAEKAELEAWINEDPTYRHLIDDYLWDREKQDLPVLLEMDEQSIDQKIRALLQWPEPRSIRRIIKEYWVAAAVVILIICMCLYPVHRTNAELGGVPKDPCIIFQNGDSLYLNKLTAGKEIKKNGLQLKVVGERHLVYSYADGPPSEMKTTYQHILSIPYGQSWRVTLTDGSDIQLNAGSAVKYTVNNLGAERKAAFRGEVFFDVTPNPHAPFKVSAGKFQAVATGTAFCVKKLGRTDSIRTILLRGSMEVSKGKLTKILTPGQEACVIMNASDSIRVRQSDTTERLSWQADSFYFKSLTLGDAMLEVIEWYGLERDVYGPGVDPSSRYQLDDRHFARTMKLSDLLKQLENDRLYFVVKDNVLRVYKK